MTQSVVRLLSVIAALERQFQLTDLEREQRRILYVVAHLVAEGREVRLADVASSGICSSASVHRHVRKLVAKNVLQLHGDTKFTVSLGPRLAGYEKAFMTAIARLDKALKGRGL